jgi:polysaccharide deacetylase family protein (PEP-CTERM system associated)
VCEIADAGHEVACHGYGHRLIYRQTQQAFAQDLDRALDAIGRALAGRSGANVRGYRAPSFSITRDSLWALQMLRDRGFSYDSSVFPLLAHDRYGIPDARRFAHQLHNGLWEVPLSTVCVGGRNWPLAGGGYFRLYPYWLIRWGLNRISAEGQPAVLYFHPWEFDPGQPRIDGLEAMKHLRHYLGLSRTASHLCRLLNENDFGPIGEVFGLA